MFCPKCRSLLYPKDGVLTCKKCGYRKEAKEERRCIMTQSREREFMVIEEEGGTLPTTDDVECPKCGNGKAYWVLRQTRAADEPETRIYRCTNCSHSWREY